MPRPIEIPANGRGSDLPDFFQDLSFPIIHASIPNTTHCVPLLYAERTLVIDSINCGVATSDGLTLQVISVTNPADTTGTVLHSTTIDLSTTGTKSPTIDHLNNLVPTGSWVLAKLSGNANTIHMSVHIRYRTRQA